MKALPASPTFSKLSVPIILAASAALLNTNDKFWLAFQELAKEAALSVVGKVPI
jgi:hypothetical protein